MTLCCPLSAIFPLMMPGPALAEVLLPLATVVGGFFDAAEITHTAGQGLVIESAGTRYVVWVVVAVMTLVAALLCWRKRVPGGVVGGLVVFAGMIVAGVLPSLAREGAQVSPEKLRVRMGMWLAPKTQEVRLADVVRIEEGQERPTSGKSRPLMTIWYFQMKDGRWERVPLPKLVATHREAVAKYLARHGHPVLMPGRQPQP